MFGDKTESAQDILKQADMAMYAAKQSGRDCSHFFSDAMQEEAINRLNLEEELREALLAPWEHFELFYQLQVDRNGHATGAEALIRWHHPEHGLVLPCTFIPLAELTGLIIPLGNWVIEAACKQLASWQEQGKKLNLAVNVSSNQFLSDGFAEFLENQLIKYKINPLSLEIEITESLILDDKDKAVAVMLELRKHGITFSIDDFGTGYSSLQYLTTLPISKLKIDQSFVRDITTDEHDAAVVKTIILMTENLGMQVIAEGVEAEIEHKFLIENGCGLFQGYLFSKPVDIDTFNAQFLSDEYVDVARNH
jgi:EAL domain-containing protein (putative c-di-GMP-specific phosphodiesterase class I)